MPETIIRDLRLDEASLAGQFFHEHWRPNHVFYREPELLFWMYHENPYAATFTDGLTIKVCFQKDDLIGVFCYMPFRWNQRGVPGVGCYLSAWWVHPDHRRGPTGTRLLHELQHHMGFDVCLSGMNTQIAETIYDRLGWTIIRNIPRMILFLDHDRALGMLDREGVSRSRSLDARIQSSLPRSFPTQPGLSVADLIGFAQLSEIDWNAFYWDEIAPDRIGPGREVVYLTWRYQHIPGFRYHGLLAHRGGAPRGLLVYRLEPVIGGNELVVRLVDLVAAPEAIRPLISTLTERAIAANAVLIDFFCTTDRYREVFTALGYIDAVDASGDYWFPYLFRPLESARTRLNAAYRVRDRHTREQWPGDRIEVMKGDYEFDRPN